MVMHFSVDDFIDAMLALQEGEYQSLFEQPTFAMLQRVHKACGAVFSCYCFYEAEAGNLSRVPGKYAEEFQANANWLRFGFHGYNTNSNYGSAKFTDGDMITDGEIAGKHYALVIGELIRITGGGRCIDRFPRIHYYAGTAEDCLAWKQAEYGIGGLISAEDDRVCYYHDEKRWKELILKSFYHEEQLGLDFWRTCIRLENVKDMAVLAETLDELTDYQNRGKDYLVFTHEKYLKEKRIEDYFICCGRTAKEKGITMGYFYEGKGHSNG